MRPPETREGVSLACPAWAKYNGGKSSTRPAVGKGLSKPLLLHEKSRTRNRHLSLRLIRLLFL